MDPGSRPVPAAGSGRPVVPGRVRGTDLRRLLARGEPLPVEVAVLIALDVAEGLGQARAVHGALTPDAVMVTPEGEVRVLDVSLPPGAAEDDAQVETLAYCAPEVWRGEPPGAPADVFSLAAILYELTAGTRAFPGRRAVEVRRLVESGPPPPSPRVTDARLFAIFAEALQPRSDLRLASMPALRNHLVAILGGRAARARADLASLVKPNRSNEALMSEKKNDHEDDVEQTVVSESPLQAGQGQPKWPATEAPLTNMPERGPELGGMTMPDFPVVVDDSATGPVNRVDAESEVPKPREDTGSKPEELPPTPAAGGPRFRQTQAWIPTVKKKPGGPEPKGPPGPGDFTNPGFPMPVPPAKPGQTSPASLLAKAEEMRNQQGGQQGAPPADNEGTRHGFQPLARPGAQAPTMQAPRPEPVQARPAPPPTVPTPVPASAIWQPPPEPQKNKMLPFVIIGVVAVAVGGYLLFGRSSPKPVPGNDTNTNTQMQKKMEPEGNPTGQPKTEPKTEAKTEAKTEPKGATNGTAAAGGNIVDVSSKPKGAAVWIDGEERGKTPVQLSLKPGEHKVVVLADGQKLRRETVRVDGPYRQLSLQLEEATLPAGLVGESLVEVRCKTEGRFRILLDDHDTGFQCPNEGKIAVTPGPHRIGLYDAHTDQTYEIPKEVAPGEKPTRVNVKL